MSNKRPPPRNRLATAFTAASIDMAGFAEYFCCYEDCDYGYLSFDVLNKCVQPDSWRLLRGSLGLVGCQLEAERMVGATVVKIYDTPDRCRALLRDLGEIFDWANPPEDRIK